MMVFVSLCNRLQQIEFRSMLRFLFILANETLLLVWDCQPFTKRGNVPSFAWMQTWRWTFFARNLSPIHMPKNMIFIWKALRFFLSKEGHFQPCFHSRPGNSMRNCEVVYLKPYPNKYYLPTCGFWWAVCDLSFHSLLLKMWMECYDQWFCFSNAIFVTICLHITAKWNWQTLILLLSQSKSKGLFALLMLIYIAYDLV